MCCGIVLVSLSTFKYSRVPEPPVSFLLSIEYLKAFFKTTVVATGYKTALVSARGTSST